MKRSLLSLLMILLLAASMQAQLFFDNRPAFWPALSLRKSFGDHWRVTLEHSTRMKFSPFMLDESYIQLATEYKFNPAVAVEMNYRFSGNFDMEDGWTPAHRISAEADFRTNAKRWYFTLHPAVQWTFSREDRNSGRDFGWAIRPKMVIDYDIAKTSLEPYAALELYIGKRAPEEPFSAYKYRGTLGLDYNIKKYLGASIFIRQQGGLFNTYQRSYTIAGLEFTFKI